MTFRSIALIIRCSSLWLAVSVQARGEAPLVKSTEPHWAFIAPVKPKQATGIDAILADEHRKHGLVTQPAAEPALWLRRIYLDLIGLPPSLAEQDSFSKAFAIDAKTARAAVADQLLASPHYGERWGRHFMDIYRYSDWYGLGEQLRYSQKHLWHWRDWIVESLNTNKAYDRMIQEMLAGDELSPANPDALRGTGFLARSYYLFNRTTWLDEVIEHTGKAFLGITMNCVKCHTHKYDPFQHEEYYAFRAIFEPFHVRLDELPGQPDLEKDGLPRAYDLHVSQSTYLHEKGDEKRPITSHPISPAVPAALAFRPLDIRPITLKTEASRPQTQSFVIRDHLAAAKAEAAKAKQAATAKNSPAQQQQLRIAELKLVAIESSLAQRPSDPASTTKAIAANLALLEAQAEQAAADAKPAKLNAAKVALANARKNLAAGKGEPYQIVASLKALEGPDETDKTRYLDFPQTSTGRRLALARWITDRQNPLAARVLVNHVWMRHFGQPLVANVIDFGMQKPKAPALQTLLDSLSVEFMDSGWNLKYLHRIIVLSDTYALTSSNAEAATTNIQNDPENQYYWRMNPMRMDAQSLRDAMLNLAGKLDLTVGGPTIDPGTDGKTFRRSLYFNQTRDQENLFLSTFDNANVLDCYRRAESIVPQQALAMMNAKTPLLAADSIAAVINKSIGTKGDEAFIQTAFNLLLATSPSDEEQQTCREALKTLSNDNTSRTALIHTLLNHQDFITIR